MCQADLLSPSQPLLPTNHHRTLHEQNTCRPLQNLIDIDNLNFLISIKKISSARHSAKDCKELKKKKKVANRFQPQKPNSVGYITFMVHYFLSLSTTRLVSKRNHQRQRERNEYISSPGRRAKRREHFQWTSKFLLECEITLAFSASYKKLSKQSMWHRSKQGQSTHRPSILFQH